MAVEGALSQTERMEAAEHIRAIGTGEGDFPAYHAEAIHALLKDMPITTMDVVVSGELKYQTKGRAAVGVGNVDLEESKKFAWDPLNKEFRCGPYVVKRTDDATYTIRHVGDVNADFADGELLKLAREKSGWVAYLNRVRRFKLWKMEAAMGGFFVEWKRSIGV